MADLIDAFEPPDATAGAGLRTESWIDRHVGRHEVTRDAQGLVLDERHWLPEGLTPAEYFAALGLPHAGDISTEPGEPG